MPGGHAYLDVGLGVRHYPTASTQRGLYLALEGAYMAVGSYEGEPQRGGSAILALGHKWVWRFGLALDTSVGVGLLVLSGIDTHDTDVVVVPLLTVGPGWAF